MFESNTRKYRSAVAECDQKGAVLLEWAIVAFGLIMGFLIFFDTGSALNTYMTLANAVSEGALMAARVPELEAGSNTDLSPTPTEKQKCETLQATTFPCGQNLIQQRVGLLIDQLVTNLDPTSVHITTRYVAPNTFGNEQDSTVTVTVTGNYRGIILRAFPITTSKQSLYLFRRG